MKKKCLAILVITAISLSACTTASLTTKNGVALKYQNFFFQKQIGEFSMSSDGKVQLKGVQSEAANLVQAVSEGVATGLGKVVVP